MKGILADVHMTGDVQSLMAAMQRAPWTVFWESLALALFRFEDVGLTPTSTDVEIWQRCQAEELILITNNRNQTRRIRWKVPSATGTRQVLCQYSPSEVFRVFKEAENMLTARFECCLTTCSTSTVCAARGDCICRNP